jgi:hypothetical protein
VGQQSPRQIFEQPLARQDCSKYPSVLTGARRANPVKVSGARSELGCGAPFSLTWRSLDVKVFDLVVLGYELDLLEARLYELDESVDVFVILEGSRAHRGYRKPLFFQENLARFEPFLHKIMYLVVDDGDIWKHRQERDKSDGLMKGSEVPQVSLSCTQ